MLISCPKCHSIYEIPDDLIPRTGQNFRCQACSNIWHALREDAIGYDEEVEQEEPYIEAIPVSVPPHRHYPANKSAFQIPADTKSGKKTRSSKDILKEEGYLNSIPSPQPTKKKEITLTSDKGTAFTISAAPFEDEEETRFFNSKETTGLKANIKERLELQKPFKGYKKTYAFLIILIVLSLTVFLRRELTAVVPDLEPYYNKIGISGQNNPEQLSIKEIKVEETSVDDKKLLYITAKIHNDSFLTTYVPKLTISGSKETYTPKNQLLKGYDSTTVEIFLPVENSLPKSLTLGFVKP